MIEGMNERRQETGDRRNPMLENPVFNLDVSSLFFSTHEFRGFKPITEDRRLQDILSLVSCLLFSSLVKKLYF